MDRTLIVTHRAPDLDAIASSWLLKRFDTQNYGNAKFAFVNPGETLDDAEREAMEIEPENVVHVDTGLGEYDHHQPERGRQAISATSLVHQHLLEIHPELKNDQALSLLIQFVTDIDHFKSIYWPEADHYRYCFMLHQIIHGLEFIQYHDDDSQLHFGFTCLEGVYSALKQQVKADEVLTNKAEYFQIEAGHALGVETRNDEILKLAQKRGIVLVIRKDSEQGHIRIKARPDTDIDLKALYERVIELDKEGTWFYHPSGKMLINGSRKHNNQTPSPLKLEKIVELTKEIYG